MKFSRFRLFSFARTSILVWFPGKVTGLVRGKLPKLLRASQPNDWKLCKDFPRWLFPIFEINSFNWPGINRLICHKIPIKNCSNIRGGCHLIFHRNERCTRPNKGQQQPFLCVIMVKKGCARAVLINLHFRTQSMMCIKMEVCWWKPQRTCTRRQKPNHPFEPGACLIYSASLWR